MFCVHGNGLGLVLELFGHDAGFDVIINLCHYYFVAMSIYGNNGPKNSINGE